MVGVDGGAPFGFSVGSAATFCMALSTVDAGSRDYSKVLVWSTLNTGRAQQHTHKCAGPGKGYLCCGLWENLFLVRHFFTAAITVLRDDAIVQRVMRARMLIGLLALAKNARRDGLKANPGFFCYSVFVFLFFCSVIVD